MFNRGPLARSNTADGVTSLSSLLKKVSWPYHEQIKNMAYQSSPGHFNLLPQSYLRAYNY